MLFKVLAHKIMRQFPKNLFRSTSEAGGDKLLSPTGRCCHLSGAGGYLRSRFCKSDVFCSASVHDAFLSSSKVLSLPSKLKFPSFTFKCAQAKSSSSNNSPLCTKKWRSPDEPAKKENGESYSTECFSQIESILTLTLPQLEEKTGDLTPVFNQEKYGVPSSGWYKTDILSVNGTCAGLFLDFLLY